MGGGTMKTIYGLSLVAALGGSSPAQAMLMVSPTSIDFGDVQVEQMSQQTIWVQNDGPEATNGLDVENLCGPDFGVMNTCGPTLQADESCEVAISFQPTSTGPQSCNLQI